MTPGPDCERRRPRFPAEPVNAFSSLSFLPGALVLAARAQRNTRGNRGDPASDRLLAAALAANGIGSAWYHARFGRLSRWSHDWAIAALLWLLAVGSAGPQARRRLELAGLTASAITQGALPESAPVVQAVVAVSSAVAWGRTARRDDRWSLMARRRAALAAVASVAGAACYLAGRTGSPCCRPDSRLQPHAAWHLLAAVASTALALDVADARS
jgi:hypothetical protein